MTKKKWKFKIKPDNEPCILNTLTTEESYNTAHKYLSGFDYRHPFKTKSYWIIVGI